MTASRFSSKQLFVIYEILTGVNRLKGCTDSCLDPQTHRTTEPQTHGPTDPQTHTPTDGDHLIIQTPSAAAVQTQLML